MNSIRIRQVGIAVVVIATLLVIVMFALLYSERDRKARNLRKDDALADFRGLGRDMDPAAAWVGRSEAKLESISQDNAALKRELERLRELMHQKPEPGPPPEPSTVQVQPQETPVFEPSPLPMPPPLPTMPPPAPPSTPTTFTPFSSPVVSMPDAKPATPTDVEPPVPFSMPPGSAPGTGVLVVDLAADAALGDKEATSPRAVGAYLPAGSFAKAALLTGLDAPTGGVAQTNPVPVLLSLADDGSLPNRFRHRVKECFVTAAGYGDLAAERAYLRLERLSCVIRDGQVLDLELSGYVVGEDGKAGMRGRPVSKQGAVIARALLAGLASGVSEGLSQSLTTLSTSALGSVRTIDSGQIAQYGLARGAGTAMDQLARWYLERANELYPIIEIGSGRKVEVVLTRGLDLPVDLFGAG